MYKLINFLIIVVMSGTVYAEIMVTEIMYNPSSEMGDDSDLEWIELYNNGSATNLSAINFDIDGNNNSFNYTMQSEEFIVVARELDDSDDSDNKSFNQFYQIGNITVFDGFFTLGNTQGYITIHYENTSYSFEYDNSLGADGNGLSLWLLNDSWEESCVEFGSPGIENYCEETNESFENTTNESSVCKVSINLSTDKTIYESGEQIKINYALNNESVDFIVEYWVEDLFNNTVKNKVESSNTNQKTYTPSIEESDKAFIVKAWLKNVSCNDSNQTDNYAETLAVVKLEQEEVEEESSISIESFEDYTSFGDIIKVKLDIHKGNTNKNSVKALIKDDDKVVSETTTMNLYSKNTDYTLRVPIVIKPNCDQSYEEKTYNLEVNGLDKTVYEEIDLAGVSQELCKTMLVNQPTQQSNGEVSFQLLNEEDNFTINKTIRTSVEVENSNFESHQVKIWSYIYRGSKCYSCETDRTENYEEFIIQPNQQVIVNLENIVGQADTGNYKLKVKMSKDNQTTHYELTKNIKLEEKKVLIEKSSFTNEQIKVDKEETGINSRSERITSAATKEVVYESSSAKSKKLIYYLVLLIFGFLTIITLWNKLK